MKKRGPKRRAVTADQLVEFIYKCLFVSWGAVLLRFLISKETVRRRIRESGETLVRSLNKNKRYFSLTRVIQKHMDENGIGICKGIVCSIHEDAKTTILHLVNRSRCGCTELELREYLKIVAKWALLELYNAGLVSRAKFGHHYVYFSKDAEKRKNQIILRHGQEPRCGILFDAVDLKLVMGSVGARLRKIVHDVLTARGDQGRRLRVHRHFDWQLFAPFAAQAVRSRDLSQKPSGS